MRTSARVEDLTRNEVLGLWGLPPSTPNAASVASMLRSLLAFGARADLCVRPASRETLDAFEADCRLRVTPASAAEYRRCAERASKALFAVHTRRPRRNARMRGFTLRDIPPDLISAVSDEVDRLLDPKEAVRFRRELESETPSPTPPIAPSYSGVAAALQLPISTTDTFAQVTEALDERTADALGKVTRRNTQRNYRAKLDAYVLFSFVLGVSPFPIARRHALRFLAWRLDKALSGGDRAPHQSLQLSVSAMQRVHAMRGMAPVFGRGDIELSGLLAQARAAAKPLRKAHPLSTDEVRRISMHLLGQGTLKAVRDRALILTGFGAATRGSELTSRRDAESDVDPHDAFAHDLTIGRVTFTQSGFILQLGRTKTGEACDGDRVYVTANADPVLCPVLALRAWLETLAGVGVFSGPLFPSLQGRGDRLSGDASVKSRAMLRQDLDRVLKLAARAIGINRRVTSHSLRRGHAVTALRNGAGVALVQRQGRWKTPRMVMEYAAGLESEAHNSSQFLGGEAA